MHGTKVGDAGAQAMVQGILGGGGGGVEAGKSGGC